MTLASQKSTFPVGISCKAQTTILKHRVLSVLFFCTALGVRITGVDDATYSQTGESYSMISMPNADSHMPRVLQEDNTELAYEFARKFRTFRATQTLSATPFKPTSH